MNLVDIRGLRKQFVSKNGLFGKVSRVNAVNDVDMTIIQGEVLALVGESGSGKSTLGRLVAGLENATEGEIFFGPDKMAGLRGRRMLSFRRRVQMIYQDPFSSLNPHMRIRDMLSEPLRIHRLVEGKAAMRARVGQLMTAVGLSPTLIDRFPHEFSGGQRQRLSIARALAVEPEFLIADEAVSALDVSTQAQVVNLIGQLKRDLQLTVLFISHNLAVVQNVADRVAVLYLGRILEIGPTEEIFARPLHPYTRALLAAVPIPDPMTRKRQVALQGEIPSPMNPPSGCVFRTRCPFAIAKCATDVPPLRETENARFSACIRDDIEPKGSAADNWTATSATQVTT